MHTGDICIVAPETVHAVSAFSDDCIIYNVTIRSAAFEQTFLNPLPQHGILFDFSHVLFTRQVLKHIFTLKQEKTLLCLN